MSSSTKTQLRDSSMINPIGLLDTSVIIDLPSLPIDRLPTEGTISAITLAELSVGPITAKDATTRIQRQLRIQAAEAQFSVLPFDTRSARIYAIVYELLHAKGVKARGGRALDLMIAATALAHQLPLYTRNPKDFAGLDGLIEIVAV